MDISFGLESILPRYSTIQPHLLPILHIFKLLRILSFPAKKQMRFNLQLKRSLTCLFITLSRSLSFIYSLEIFRSASVSAKKRFPIYFCIPEFYQFFSILISVFFFSLNFLTFFSLFELLLCSSDRFSDFRLPNYLSVPFYFFFSLSFIAQMS